MDDSFFKELVEDLGIITKVKYVFIAQCQGDVTPDCVDTIAFWSKGKIIDNIRYALYCTPCEDVLKGNIRIYSERLQALFPEDEDKKHFECLMKTEKSFFPGLFSPPPRGTIFLPKSIGGYSNQPTPGWKNGPVRAKD